MAWPVHCVSGISLLCEVQNHLEESISDHHGTEIRAPVGWMAEQDGVSRKGSVEQLFLLGAWFGAGLVGSDLVPQLKGMQVPGVEGGSLKPWPCVHSPARCYSLGGALCVMAAFFCWRHSNLQDSLLASYSLYIVSTGIEVPRAMSSLRRVLPRD